MKSQSDFGDSEDVGDVSRGSFGHFYNTMSQYLIVLSPTLPTKLFYPQGNSHLSRFHHFGQQLFVSIYYWLNYLLSLCCQLVTSQSLMQEIPKYILVALLASKCRNRIRTYTIAETRPRRTHETSMLICGFIDCLTIYRNRQGRSDLPEGGRQKPKIIDSNYMQSRDTTPTTQASASIARYGMLLRKLSLRTSNVASIETGLSQIQELKCHTFRSIYKTNRIHTNDHCCFYPTTCVTELCDGQMQII